MQIEVSRFGGGGDLAAALAGAVRAAAEAALAERGRFALAIPGGSVVGLLARGFEGVGIDFADWHWFFADERCVGLDHADSNYLLARGELFDPLGIAPDRVHPIDGARGPDRAAREYAEELGLFFAAEAGGSPRFDLVVLGVGEDGHVASLFPGNAALEEAHEWTVPVRHSPKPPPQRVSLSLGTINWARDIVVVASGAGKAEMVAKALGEEGGDPSLPVRRLCPAEGRLRWMVDEAAAERLPEMFFKVCGIDEDNA
jgi:6-phosphogluconolactonase